MIGILCQGGGAIPGAGGRSGLGRGLALAGELWLAGVLLPAALAGQSAGRLQVGARVIGAEAAWEALAQAQAAVRALAGRDGVVAAGPGSELAEVRVERIRAEGEAGAGPDAAGGEAVVVTTQYLRN